MGLFNHQLPAVYYMVRFISAIRREAKKNTFNAADLLEENVRRRPHAIAVEDAEDLLPSMTWKEVDTMANQMSHWSRSLGLGRGDAVCICMGNRPDYLGIWMGLAKQRIIGALINHNLRGETLKHALRESKANVLIVDAEHAAQFADLIDDFPDYRWFVVGKGDAPEAFQSLSVELAKMPTDPAPAPVGEANDTLFLIYTSGTTGAPKAAYFSHLRYFAAANSFGLLSKATPEDAMYIALPLYHSNGGVIGTGIALRRGCRMVIRRKFSASAFLDDCRKKGVTHTMYIGEALRYLLNQPPRDNDRDHPVKMALGNGLRPDIWEEFANRFGIKTMEFYGSTEGNVVLMNFLYRPKAIGYLPSIISSLLPYVMVKYDVENDEIVRDKNGFCIPVGPGEVGEILGEIRARDPHTQFKGYTNKEASARKILRDVRKKGDEFFRSGDLLKMDEDGFVYFMDRVGDTFRWKSENVATTEVAERMNDLPGILDAAVYGVKVPKRDGRAGMAALIVGDDFDIRTLWPGLQGDVPEYAQPVFVRILEEAVVTATYKHQKAKMRKDAYDLSLGDPIYFRDPVSKSYVPLTQEIVDGIANDVNYRV